MDAKARSFHSDGIQVGRVRGRTFKSETVELSCLAASASRFTSHSV